MRVRSLDGLRGVAAVFVVLGHMRLVLLDTTTNPIWSEPIIRHALDLLGVMGGHAVWLFFVLSGVVLTKLADRPGFDYGRYVLSRLTRLYLPVWAAVAFAVLTIVIVPRITGGYGTWIDTKPQSLSLPGILQDLTLVTGVNGGTLSPLWTLQWEVLFSLLLVFFVAAFRRLHPWIGMAVALVAVGIGAVAGNSFILYMGMFSVGVVLAFAWARIMTALDSPNRYHPALIGTATVLLLVVAIAMNSLAIILDAATKTAFGLTMPFIGTVSSLIGITIMIVLAGAPGPLRTVLEWRPVQWLGLISFSIYLVHEPVLVGVVRTMGPTVLALIIALVLCFVVAALFSRFIERPTHKIATRIRRGPAPNGVALAGPETTV